MNTTEVRVKSLRTKQVYVLEVNEDNAVKMEDVHRFFLNATGLGYLNENNEIRTLKVDAASQKIFPRTNEQWETNIDYIPCYPEAAPVQTPSSASPPRSCFSFDQAWNDICDLYVPEHEYAKAPFCAAELLLLINPHKHLNHERYAFIRYSQDVEMDLQNKYQILASEFSKVRGQVTVLKKAVIDEQTKNQQFQEEINRRDQNIRRNGQEIETLTFLNTQLQSRLEVLQQELKEYESHSKLKKTSSNKAVANHSFSNNILAQELELKIQQFEAMHRRVYELEKQISDTETERMNHRTNIEQLQNQMAEMQESHQRARDEYERILKQVKHENELLNDQVKQHLTDPPTNAVVSRKSSILNAQSKTTTEASSIPQPEILLYKYLIGWRDAFTELTIYIEERLKNNDRASENNEKMAQTVKAFQQHAENFLAELKIRFFDGQCLLENNNTIGFAELFSMFVSSCEKVLAFAIKSVCDEPTVSSSSGNQDKVYEKINALNSVLNQLFQKWASNLSYLREICADVIQIDLSLPDTADQMQAKIAEILSAFQTGALIHCDLDKNYNDKLCLEYELNVSPVHLTTTDECILAALRKLSSLEQQIAQLIRENQTYLFELQKRQKEMLQQDEANLMDFSENSHQHLMD
ncbi:unnamed protein product, partial [Adineta ricciae]